MKAIVVALLALTACQSPTAPVGEWRVVSFCTVTVGQDNFTCNRAPERCWLTYADNTFHCPSGDYPVAKPIG